MKPPKPHQVQPPLRLAPTAAHELLGIDPEIVISRSMDLRPEDLAAEELR